MGRDLNEVGKRAVTISANRRKRKTCWVFFNAVGEPRKCRLVRMHNGHGFSCVTLAVRSPTLSNTSLDCKMPPSMKYQYGRLSTVMEIGLKPLHQ